MASARDPVLAESSARVLHVMRERQALCTFADGALNGAVKLARCDVTTHDARGP
jgi:hypothetical protein